MDVSRCPARVEQGRDQTVIDRTKKLGQHPTCQTDGGYRENTHTTIIKKRQPANR